MKKKCRKKIVTHSLTERQEIDTRRRVNSRYLAILIQDALHAQPSFDHLHSLHAVCTICSVCRLCVYSRMHVCVPTTLRLEDNLMQILVAIVVTIVVIFAGIV